MNGHQKQEDDDRYGQAQGDEDGAPSAILSDDEDGDQEEEYG